MTDESRWEDVYASITTSVIDPDLWQFDLEVELGDTVYSASYCVPKIQLELYPGIFPYIWEEILALAEKHIAEHQGKLPTSISQKRTENS